MENRITLYYASDYNRFCDADGHIIHDMHNLLSPWQLDYVKNQMDSYCVLAGKGGEVIEIYTPEILDMDAEAIRYIEYDGGIYDCSINVG